MHDLETRLTSILRDKRVLVTGHTGFKGSWLATWLHLLGARVTGLALPPESEEDHFVQLQLPQYIEHIEGDIRDVDVVQSVMRDAQPEFVFHLAAQPLVRRSYDEPKLTFDTNVGGSVNVLEAIRATDSVRVAIMVSTDKCYRSREWAWGYRENDELGGSCPYSASKACAELVLSSYQKSFFDNADGPRIGSVRAGNVIGGGDWAEDRIVPDSIRALRSNNEIVLRNPNAVRPWQHVLEPLGGYLLLATKLYGDSSGRYVGSWNFGPDKMAESHGFEGDLTVGRLVETVTESWGADENTVANNGEDAHRPETSCLRLNCDKAYYQLGWRPLWDFGRTVAHTVSWYKNWLQGHDAWDLTTGQIAEYMRACADRGKVNSDRRTDCYTAEANR